MIEKMTAGQLRAFADRPTPVVEVEEPHRWRHDGPDQPALTALHRMREQAANQYGTMHGAAAARLILEAFGPTAHRAVLDQRENIDGGTAMDLLAVFDADGEVLWYDSDDVQLWRSELARDWAEIEAYGGPVLPLLAEDTKTAIEELAEIAEASPEDGYFLLCDLVIGRSGEGYDQLDTLYIGGTRELYLNEEIRPVAEILGPPAYDGSTGPQRRLLNPLERDITVRVLRDVLNSGEPPVVGMFPGDREVVAEVGRVLDPRDGDDGDEGRTYGGHISFERLAEVLRDETSVLDPDDVDNLMTVIRASAGTPAGQHRPRGIVPATDTAGSNEAPVQRLVQLAKELGVGSEALDGLVHDMHSTPASGINNGGVEAQVRYLLPLMSEADLEHEIRTSV